MFPRLLASFIENKIKKKRLSWSYYYLTDVGFNPSDMIPYLFSTTKLFLKTLIIHCLRTQATTANFVLSGINKDTSKTQDRIVILQLKYFRAIYPRHLVVIRVPKGHRANKHSPRHQLSRHCYK
jgi:hypothetical protein